MRTLQNSNMTQNIDWKIVLIFLFVFLILPPIFGLPIIIGYVWMSKRKNPTDYYVLIVCVAAYFACINGTKVVSGDQYRYWGAYNNVPIHGFWYSLMNIYGDPEAWQETPTHISGEFMNGVYNYVGYYLTFGYYPLFETLFTFTSYCLLFIGLYKYSTTFVKPHFVIVCGVLTIAFFYLYFQYTMQIQKQFFAQSIMMYAIGSYAQKGRLNRYGWIAIAFAVFTHQSMLFFVPFIVLKRFRKKMNKATFVLVLIALAGLIFYGPKILGNADMGDSALTYGARRFAQSETNNDTEDSALVFSQILVIAVPMGIICYKKLLEFKKKFVASQFFLVVIVSIILVTVMAMNSQPTAQYRFFMMLIAFMPFVYPLAFDSVKYRNVLLKAISLIMIAWFYLQFEKIVWVYAPERDILIKSPLLLVLSNYQGY